MTADFEWFAVAGGGGGGGASGFAGGGGGGAGGAKSGTIQLDLGTYPVVIGGGGVGGGSVDANGTNGIATTFNTSAIVTTGGGGGAHRNGGQGQNGGSGGGMGATASTGAGSGTVGEGNDGGTSNGSRQGGGGGGKGTAGANYTGGTNGTGANGGTGIEYWGTWYAGGGGGAGMTGGGTGGTGGGGNGGSDNVAGTVQSGAVNTGGGGGGGIRLNPGANGGSGIFGIRYLTSAGVVATGGTITTEGDYTVHRFTTSQDFEVTDTGGGGVIQRTLGITVNGTGSVARNPNQPEFDHGTNVILTATAGTDWRVDIPLWGGDVPVEDVNDNPLTLLMDQHREITANFRYAKPTNPQGFVLEDPSRVGLTWDQPDGADGFEIERNGVTIYSTAD
jgi:hypothetical protein